ncbi:MAG: hypothetical protein AVDCRST_MAG56-3506 [uncultured Cytophagales bacterium]|uniref:Uncharacterized protein n=1 Tax=uncultured Cytophagales bacterium TaxID=158755 RepID=A0A6J4JIG7_9SPHI|nr:MAG: hypothetical protein AVDCRST_MAG56-3506 [uncultured Cytophagales bacterium]
MVYLLRFHKKVSLFFNFLCYCPDFAKRPAAPAGPLPGSPRLPDFP